MHCDVCGDNRSCPYAVCAECLAAITALRENYQAVIIEVLGLRHKLKALEENANDSASDNATPEL